MFAPATAEPIPTSIDAPESAPIEIDAPPPELVQAAKPVELSLEQQFSVRSFETQVKQMSREQAQEFLVNLYEQMLLRETMYRAFLKKQWNLDATPSHNHPPNP